MGRVFLSAGRYYRDPGAVAFGTTEAQEMMLTRDLIATILDSRGVNCLCVPDTLNDAQTIDWINERATSEDIAVEIRLNQLNGIARGAEVYYLANNQIRQNQAEALLGSLLTAVPELPSRGAKPDSIHPIGALSFCREVQISSLVIGLGFIDNPEDLNLLLNYRQNFAEGIAVGLQDWSQQIPLREYPIFKIRVKDWEYPDSGIAINHNPYLPLDLVENLNLEPDEVSLLRRINYGNVVYIKAVDLQPLNIAIHWNETLNALVLQPALPDGLEDIMTFGQADEEKLQNFLAQHNPVAGGLFPNLAKLYIQEADLEGVNSDLAFCQMCLETNFLTFGGEVTPEQNNFASLGAVGGHIAGASFPDPQTGVRAHIQHLKAFASNDMLNALDLVDPRFKLVPRGVATTVNDLSGRWNADFDYGKKIMAIMRQLYGHA
jgi:hypothetical protein